MAWHLALSVCLPHTLNYIKTCILGLYDGLWWHGTYLCQCRRGIQISATCSVTAGWGRPHAVQVSSGWQTALRCRWGNWAWRRRCGAPHRMTSGCSLTFYRRSRRWHRPLGRTESRLEREGEREGSVRMIERENKIRHTPTHMSSVWKFKLSW